MPLLHQIELHQKGDERIKALRRGPPSCWERLGDWRRARKLRKEQARLKATSAELLHELHNASDAQRVVSAIVTFEEEEGRLEALHAFPPLGLGSCPTGAPVAKEAPEPSDRLLHNLEHRGSFGNLARALFSLRRQFLHIDPSPSLQLIVELQQVLAPPDAPGKPPKTTSLGWTSLDLFSAQRALNAG